MNIREDLADAIRAEVPKGWTVVPHGVAPSNPRNPIVAVRQQSVERTKGAPRLYRDTDFLIALIEPEIDLKKVEDALDDDLETLLDIIEALKFPGLLWKTATRSTFDNAFHGYDITVTVTNEKE